MNSELVERIVHAVLYEGYMLYPYRQSAIKNQQGWNFGVLTPRAYSEAQCGTEAWTMQTECLVQQTKKARLNISVRFLQLVLPGASGNELSGEAQKAIEREVSTADQSLAKLTSAACEVPFRFDANHTTDLFGLLEINAELMTPKILKLRIGIKNLTSPEGIAQVTRDEVLRHSFISTHTVLNIEGGEFVSLMDPPDQLQQLAASCENKGCWPVLVGTPGERDCMLSSPIILYDYPQLAPESVGDLYDSTEIDELLTLRVLTLTEEEKHEMRHGDARTREILDRTEGLPWEHLARVHGAVRGLAAVKDENRD
jgi:hypothetical protein